MTANEEFYALSATTIRKQPFSFNELRGKLVLIVNTASRCGFTPQYKGLEALYQKYKNDLVVLGFPSNQFNQEIQEESIESECQVNFGVTFPLMQVSNVNGDNENPVFAFLKKEKPGILGLKMIKWNFEKFLVDRNGNVVNRYASTSTPAHIEADIQKLL